MLKTIGVNSIDELIKQTIPANLIDPNSCVDIGPALSEQQMLNKMRYLASKNKLYKTYIGNGKHFSALLGEYFG